MLSCVLLLVSVVVPILMGRLDANRTITTARKAATPADIKARHAVSCLIQDRLAKRFTSMNDVVSRLNVFMQVPASPSINPLVTTFSLLPPNSEHFEAIIHIKPQSLFRLQE